MHDGQKQTVLSSALPAGGSGEGFAQSGQQWNEAFDNVKINSARLFSCDCGVIIEGIAIPLLSAVLKSPTDGIPCSNV